MNITEKLENTVQEAVMKINNIEKSNVDYSIISTEKYIIVILSNSFRDCMITITEDKQNIITSDYIVEIYYSDIE